MVSFLWFTSTTSYGMQGYKPGENAYAGLYKCKLDKDSGKCLEKPDLIVDEWMEVNGQHHKILDLMNSFEILRASFLIPNKLESFFRTTQDVSNNYCSGFCCPGAGHAYFEVQPRDYVIDRNEIFVSWDGFYLDCKDNELISKDKKLLWRVGVSKIKQTPECVLNGGLTPVIFAECTEPVSILYREEGMARDVWLGYSGIAVSLSPSGKRVFFVSVIDNSINGLMGAGGLPINEIWVMAEGEHFGRDPTALQKIGGVGIATEFLNYSVDDVGTIRLRLNEKRIPTGLCRTAFDAGVYCYALSMEAEHSIIKVLNEKIYVTMNQLAESCTITSEHFPITKILPPVSTGLEVLWTDDSPDELPEMLFFGCYGEIVSHGNFTTAFADGRITQTLKGGYPGTILFGADVTPVLPSNDYIQPSVRTTAENEKRGINPGFSVVFILSFLAAAVITSRRVLKNRNAYASVAQLEDDSDPEASHNTAGYVELSSTMEL